MTGCRDMDKKHQKCPKNGAFPPFVTPMICFKNWALSLLYLYGALTLCKKLQKMHLRYLKTDRLTDRGDYIGPPLANPVSKMRSAYFLGVIGLGQEICTWRVLLSGRTFGLLHRLFQARKVFSSRPIKNSSPLCHILTTKIILARPLEELVCLESKS